MFSVHGQFDWGVCFYGVLAIAVGLGFALSTQFSSFVFKNDQRAVIWASLFGDRIKTRYIVSCFAILVGVFCIYLAFHPDT